MYLAVESQSDLSFTDVDCTNPHVLRPRESINTHNLCAEMRTHSRLHSINRNGWMQRGKKSAMRIARMSFVN